MTETRCACGKLLHYSSTFQMALVESFVKRSGETVPVHTPQGKWRVPRHYIALHGIKEQELPELAKRLGFEPIP